MTDDQPLTEAKTNRSRTEIGRISVELLDSSELIKAVQGDSGYDVQFLLASSRPKSTQPLLEAKTDRSRAEIGRAISDLLDRHETVWITNTENEYDVQMYAQE